jgi:hypothetical protein
MKLATNTTIYSCSKSHPLELTTKKLRNYNLVTKKGASKMGNKNKNILQQEKL